MAEDVDVVTDGQTLAFSVEANSNESLVEVTAVSGDSTGSGKLIFDVKPDQHGVATILVMVTDSQGATDLESTTLTVTEVNDQPIANMDPLMVFENDIPDDFNHNFMGDDEDSVDNFDYQIDTLQLADIASNWDKISRLENNPIWTSSDKMVTMDTSGGEFLLPLEETKPPQSNYQSMKYGIDPEFHLHYSAEIRIKTNLGGIPIYLDGKYLGETPIKDRIQVEPGWHQVSGFSPVFIQSATANEFLNDIFGAFYVCAIFNGYLPVYFSAILKEIGFQNMSRLLNISRLLHYHPVNIIRQPSSFNGIASFPPVIFQFTQGD